MTKTEMAEGLQIGIEQTARAYASPLFDRYFKELFDDFKVKLQEQIEQDIEDEEREFAEYEEETASAEAFGNGIMEGE